MQSHKLRLHNVLVKLQHSGTHANTHARAQTYTNASTHAHTHTHYTACGHVAQSPSRAPTPQPQCSDIRLPA